MSLLVILVICSVLVSSCGLFFASGSSFSICCKSGLVVLKALNCCLSVKLLLSPSNQNESLAG